MCNPFQYLGDSINICVMYKWLPWLHVSKFSLLLDDSSGKTDSGPGWLTVCAHSTHVHTCILHACCGVWHCVHLLNLLLNFVLCLCQLSSLWLIVLVWSQSSSRDTGMLWSLTPRAFSKHTFPSSSHQLYATPTRKDMPLPLPWIIMYQNLHQSLEWGGNCSNCTLERSLTALDCVMGPCFTQIPWEKGRRGERGYGVVLLILHYVHLVNTTSELPSPQPPYRRDREQLPFALWPLCRGLTLTSLWGQGAPPIIQTRYPPKYCPMIQSYWITA